MEGEMQLLG